MSETPDTGQDISQPGVDDKAAVPPVAPRSAAIHESRGFAGNLAAGARLVFFLKAGASRFDATANQLIALVALGLVVNVAAGFAFVGTEGFFDVHALPSAVFGILLVLLAGHVIGGVLDDRRFGMLIPVAVAAAAVILNIIADCLWLAVDRGWISLKDGVNSMELYHALLAWWTAAMLLAVARFSGGSARKAILPMLVFAAVVLLPTYFLPAGWLWGADDADESDDPPQSFAAVQEPVLYAQPELLRSALEKIQPQRRGIADLYFVGFAPYAAQDVFMKEMNSVDRLLRERFDTEGRSITLVNNAALAGKAPIASLTSLRRALKAVGERIDPAEDIVLLHVTTHGSESHELSAEFWPLQLAQVTPADLRSALDEAGIKWRIVVVSACYSGGFIDALKDPGTLVLTAADARHTSFGCADDSDYTYFSRAYFDEALRKTHSFVDAFSLAKQWIRVRELKEGLDPSNPQISVGEGLVPRLDALQQRLMGLGAGK
ncbi:MAG TPA: C13 family peptidase [Burkholderiales bacterium]